GGKASKKVLFEIASQGRMRSGALSRVVTVYRGILEKSSICTSEGY
ncbi:MAG: hypothetical protein JRJ00_18635, partial [Deltaproteobacteria bacterium]|nr:hypothetical protein [Deltaproteobacteria bacterium]